MVWERIKKSIVDDLLSRNLSDPRIRLNALENIERIFLKHLIEYIDDPIKNFNAIDKVKLKELLTQYKGKELNGAESSIINEIYRRI